MNRSHFWATSQGIASTGSRDNKPFKDKPKIRVKYLGEGPSRGWPKTLSNGRVLYQHNTVPKKRLIQSSNN